MMSKSPFFARCVWVLSGLMAGLVGCGATNDPSTRNNLSAMQKTQFSIKGHAFDVWLALSPQEQEFGLMQVSDAEMAPLADGTERAMLFVFANEQPLAFWMQNTIIPLDIIFFRDDGRIVSRYTMAPLETRLYPSIEPARYALEARAGVFETFGIDVGDQVNLPDSVLKASR